MSITEEGKLKAFEIFITKENITSADWDLLVTKVNSFSSRFTLELSFDANIIEIYIYCDKDLSLLSTKIENFVLIPSDRRLVDLKRNGKRIGTKLSTRINFLELRDKEEFRNSRKIKNVFISINEKIGFKLYSIAILSEDKIGGNFYSTYTTFTNPLISFEINFKETSNLKKKSLPITLKFNSALELLRKETERPILEVFGFPYFSKPEYVEIDSFDFNKHSLIVGQTGVGKSKFIELFVNAIRKKEDADDYAVVIIDPHSNLFQEQGKSDLSHSEFDFINTYCELFPYFSEPKIATELTILLFKTLLAEQFNAKMERTLKYVLYTLFLTNNMNVENIKKMLLDLDFRKEVLSGLSTSFSHMLQFFDTEFIEMQTKYYEIAIMPILVLIDELEFLPAFTESSSENLEESIQVNFLTTFSLNKIYLGDKATKLIAGLIIQQLFLIAQKRSVNKKIILIIDEVSTVENESLIHILSEARKFNLSLVLAQQYLTQITPELLRGILSNIYNYFVFKIHDGDAKVVSQNLDISFPDDILLSEKEKGISEEDLKRNVLTNLNPRECIVRLFGNGKFYPSFKARTINV